MNHLSARDLTDQLLDGAALRDEVVKISTFGWCLQIRSNSQALLDRLRAYFAHVVDEQADSDTEIIAIDRRAPELDIAFHDWAREPGKTGRKDSYVDLADGRLIRKVRTGMVFLQSDFLRIAAGPCLDYDNQVINFVNAQIMNRLQQDDWLICHAAAFVRAERAFAVAGFSGNGKSTLMLHALEQPDHGYLTNDRLFIKRIEGQAMARGIPKMPRINPGTLLHNPRLVDLLSPARRAALRAMRPEDLWQLEEKHDVMIARQYGADRIRVEAPLAGLLILNWSREADDPTRIAAVDIAERPDLLGAVMKSPGPFYQYSNGQFFSDTTHLTPSPYLASLRDTPVYEATGMIDFGAAITAFKAATEAE